MIGSQAKAIASSPSASPVAGLGVPVSGASGPSQATVTAQHQQSWSSGGVWVFVGLIIAYFVWAFVEQHEKVKSALEPHNMALNFRNMFLVVFTVALASLWLKVLTTKAYAILPNKVTHWAKTLVFGAF